MAQIFIAGLDKSHRWAPPEPGGAGVWTADMDGLSKSPRWSRPIAAQQRLNITAIDRSSHPVPNRQDWCLDDRFGQDHCANNGRRVAENPRPAMLCVGRSFKKDPDPAEAEPGGMCHRVGHYTRPSTYRVHQALKPAFEEALLRTRPQKGAPGTGRIHDQPHARKRCHRYMIFRTQLAG